MDTLDQNKTETAKFRFYSDVKHELDILKAMRDRIWWRSFDSELLIGKFSQLLADSQINIAYFDKRYIISCFRQFLVLVQALETVQPHKL